MAFNIQCWARLSSSANLKVVTLQNGTILGAPGEYSYISITDTAATISAADYFVTQAPLLNVGDVIRVIGSDTSVDLSVATIVAGPPASVTTVQSVGIGDVDGPAGATDNAICRFDGATGKLIQNSVAILDDTGNATGFLSITNGSGLLATPSWTFTGDTDTGMWRSGANTIDFSTNAFRALQLGASPALSVNYMIMAASATGNAYTMTAAGTDANIGIRVIPKGTGALLNSVGAVATPSYSFTGNVGTGMWSSAGGVLDFSTGALRALQLNTSPALAVNYLAITSAATGNGVLVEAEGTDANIDIWLGAKATGVVGIRGNTNAGTLGLWNQANTFQAQIKAAAMASTITWTWPATDGAAGQVLKTDGAGVLSFVNNDVGTWIDQVATPATLVVNTQYIADTAGLLTFNVPALAAVGDTFEVAGKGAGGWLIQMNAGQTAHLGNIATSVAGSLASTNQWDCLSIVCVTANTTFTVRTVIGAITVA